jgi:Sulfotransferase family
MTLPSFLIIGAMKAGTTTLYEDLVHVPGLYLPPEKEPDDLTYSEAETPRGRARYEAKFAACPPGAIAGEASTTYTKRPTFEGVAIRARRLLGPDLKLIYLTRDPVRRIISQYHHLWGLSLEDRPLNEAVLEDESYVAYSRYEWQLEPWRAVFPPEKILVLSFEDYVAHRMESLRRVCGFLGVEVPEAVDETHRNASAGKRIVPRGSAWSRIGHSDFYLYRIKPRLPTSLRDRIKSLVLPQARILSEELAPETRAEIERRLAQGPATMPEPAEVD